MKARRHLALPLALVAGLTVFDPAQVGAARADYAVVVSQMTQTDADWQRVVDVLRKKHQARVIVYESSVDEALPKLREQFPRFACFVAQPAEATREFVAKVHRLTRQLDGDPYTDCFWGILVGYDAANALHIAQHREPLTIRKVASGTELAMEMVEEGVWYCELNKNKMVKKEKGGEARELKGPDDTTKALVDALNDYHADLFVTSGHATERDWMIGFRYKNGFFKHENGQLYGLDTQGKKFPISSLNPKVYLPVGNCLMGHIDQRDCMALAWMNSGGAQQMLGYTEPTWYGYMGWGVLDYFVEQPGRYTFTEAFFANHHALAYRLTNCFPELADATLDNRGRLATRSALSDTAKAAGLTANDARGLVFDRDVVAFYGDPAWQARMAPGKTAWSQVLNEKDGVWTFDITPNFGEKTFNPINRNGSQRGGRPIVEFFPKRLKNVKVIAGTELKPVVADNFILVPNPGVCEPTRRYQIVFTATTVR